MADDRTHDQDEALERDAPITSDATPREVAEPEEGGATPDVEPKASDAADQAVGAPGGGGAPEHPVDEAAAAAEAGNAAAESESGDAEAPVGETPEMNWYVLKVQVNREDSIRDAIARRVAMAGLDSLFGKILVPAEKVTEVRGGRKRTVRRKLLPGYIIVQMAITDETWFLVRETTGVGDFTGSGGQPTPMEPHEVQRLLASEEEVETKEAKIKIGFAVGDRVKINEGTFENFEGDVHAIDDTNGVVWVMINIFGRSTPVRFEYWQIEAAS